MYDISLIDILSTLLRVPHVAQNENWNTWALICNPHSQAVTVTLTFSDKDGSLVVSRDEEIPAHGSRVYSLEYYVSTTIKEGSLAIDTTASGTAGVAAFALYSNVGLVEGGYAHAGISAVDMSEQ